MSPACQALAPAATSSSAAAKPFTVRRWDGEGWAGVGMGAPVPPMTAVSLQCICARRFRGRLASIHDYGTNALLLHLARRHTNSGQVWIGGVSQPAVRTPPRTPHPGLGPSCLLPVSPRPTPGVPAPSHDSQWVP